MNPGDAQWWWDVALDGIVGGVLTGVIAALAVWRTLRHERVQIEAVELRQAVTALRAEAYRTTRNAPAQVATAREVTDWASSFAESVILAQARAGRSAPILANDLSEVSIELQELISDFRPKSYEFPGQTFNVERTVQLAQDTASFAYLWLSDPDRYARKTLSR